MANPLEALRGVPPIDAYLALVAIAGRGFDATLDMKGPDGSLVPVQGKALKNVSPITLPAEDGGTLEGKAEMSFITAPSPLGDFPTLELLATVEWMGQHGLHYKTVVYSLRPGDVYMAAILADRSQERRFLEMDRSATGKVMATLQNPDGSLAMGFAGGYVKEDMPLISRLTAGEHVAQEQIDAHRAYHDSVVQAAYLMEPRKLALLGAGGRQLRPESLTTLFEWFKSLQGVEPFLQDVAAS